MGTSLNEIKTAALRQMASQLNAVITKSQKKWRGLLEQYIEEAIVNTPEYESLHGGTLQGELGVVNPDLTIQAFTGAIKQGIIMEAGPVYVKRDSLDGRIIVKFFKKDLTEVLGAAGGSFTSEGARRPVPGVNYKVDWLEWLLTAGDRIILADYRFEGGEFRASRTKLGIMRRGGTWRIPIEFPAYPNNNWLTRAFTRANERILNIILADF